MESDFVEVSEALAVAAGRSPLECKMAAAINPAMATANGMSAKGGKLREISAFLFAIVQKHDYEDEQHHDGAAINNDLHCGNEFGAQQKVQTGKRDHYHDQRKRAVNRVTLQDQAYRAQYRQRRQHEKYDYGAAHQCILHRINRARDHEPR